MNGTCVLVTRLCKQLQKLEAFMSETSYTPGSFPDGIIFASMFDDITNWESQKRQNTCPAQANEVAILAARFRPGYWCFCGPGPEKNDHLTRLQTVNVTNSLL